MEILKFFNHPHLGLQYLPNKYENSFDTVPLYLSPYFIYIPLTFFNSQENEKRLYLSSILWHELNHFTGFFYSALSVYYTWLFYTAEKLLNELLLSSLRNKSANVENDAMYLLKFVDLFDKITTLWTSCDLCIESTATFFQLNEQSAISLVKPIKNLYENIFSQEIEEYEVKCYLKKLSFNLYNALFSSVSSANEIHRKAFRIGEKISQGFGHYSYVYYLPILCMNIDLSNIDLINCPIGNLTQLLDEIPEDLNANERLKMVAEGDRVFLRKLKEDTIKARKRLNKGILNFPLVNEFFKNHKIIRYNLLNKIKHRKPFSAVYPITWFTGEKGVIGVTFPSYLSKLLIPNGFANEYVQKILSQWVSSELMLKAFKRERTPPGVLDEMVHILDILTEKVKNPSMNHKIVESVAKNWCAQ